MLLAIAVFSYAGFLVWQLLDTPTESLPTAPTTMAPEVFPAPQPLQPTLVEAAPAPKEDVQPREDAQKPPKADSTPERKNSTKATRIRRRRQRQPASDPPSGPQKQSENAAASPAPPPDPVEIDIQNPYRN
jgi:hypothetical protein